VHNRLANWLIAAPLMLQLVIGMQWQVAHANMAPPEQASGMDAQHCPDHPSKDSRTGEGRGVGASTSAPSSHHNPVHNHDCCGSVDCQWCHGAQGPGVLGLPTVSAVRSSSVLLPFINARPPVARTNELFRPPIV
jgi:hypothetical protein